MRIIKNPQMVMGEIDISAIKFNPKSRDDIEQILKGLQHIYCQTEKRKSLFLILGKMIPSDVDKNNGRPGMELWKVFVLSILRLNLNWDYDRLLNIANHHTLIRQMLGHFDMLDNYKYELQTIKDNFKLLTVEIMEEINNFVVNCGHELVKKTEKDEQGNIVLKCRGDSFVVETNVHFPTDINLLFDAIRKAIELIGNLFESCKIPGWRQYSNNVKKLKKSYRKAQNSKKSKCKTAEATIKKAHQEYIELSEYFVCEMLLSLQLLEKECNLSVIHKAKIEEIHSYINHAKRQIEQTDRRVLKGEIITHAEKVFSIFEPHTEWIMKGKAGKPVELGIRVGVIEDQYQFILNHRVMIKETDDQVAVTMVEKAKAIFPGINSISYDRGYYSKQNRSELNKIVQNVALPKKGKLSNADKEIQLSESYTYAKGKHSAVESAINALEVHGLDKCPDHGIEGFERYVAIAIVARNIQRVGAIIHKQDQITYEKRERRRRLKLAA